MTDTTEFTPTIDPSDTTVQAMFGAVLQQKIQGGALERALGKYADKLIDDCAEDVLRSYGDVGKAIKEALAKAITPHLDDLTDFPVYHDFMAKRLRMAATNFYDQRLAEVLDKELSDIMNEMPQEITLSWVLDAVRKSIIGYGGGKHMGEYMTLHFEDSGHGYRYIYIGKEAGMEKYRCEYRLGTDGEGRLFNMKIDGDDIGNKKYVGPFYNAERKLMAAYAMKAKLVFDEGEDPGNYDTEIESWDD